MKVLRNIILNSILLLSMFIYMPRVFAKTIIVDGEVDINSYSEPTKAYFDEDTNTLVLNNYNGKYINFSDFVDGDTVNIVLKGNNVITSNEYLSVNALGQDSNDPFVLNINVTGEEGSKLTINNYYNGIFTNYGSINISNADIAITDIGYVGIYSNLGLGVTVKDSTINVDDVEYSIAADSGNISIDNLTYTSRNVIYYDFYNSGQLKLLNSNFDIADGSTISYAADVVVDNSEFEISNQAYGLNANTSMTVNNSKVTLNNQDYGLFSEEGKIIINDSTINGEFIEGAIAASKLEINDTTIDLENCYSGIFAYSILKINNSDISINNVNSTIYGEQDVEITGGTVNLTAERDDLFSPAIIANSGDLVLNTDLTIDYNVDMILPYPVVIIANGLIVNDGKVNINSNLWGVLAEKATLVSGEINILSSYGPALVVLAAEKDSSDAIELVNVYLKESDLIIDDVFYPEIHSYVNSFFTEKPLDDYEDIYELESIISGELHFANKNAIEFDSNGGAGKMNNAYVLNGKYELPNVLFAAPKDKIFKGWALDKDGKQMVTELDVKGDAKVYAIWEDGIRYIESEPEIIKEYIKEYIKVPEFIKEYIKVPEVVKEYVEVPVEVESEPKVVKEYVEVPVEVPVEVKSETNKPLYILLGAGGATALGALAFGISKFLGK